MQRIDALYDLSLLCTRYTYIVDSNVFKSVAGTVRFTSKIYCLCQRSSIALYFGVQYGICIFFRNLPLLPRRDWRPESDWIWQFACFLLPSIHPTRAGVGRELGKLSVVTKRPCFRARDRAAKEKSTTGRRPGLPETNFQTKIFKK